MGEGSLAKIDNRTKVGSLILSSPLKTLPQKVISFLQRGQQSACRAACCVSAVESACFGRQVPAQAGAFSPRPWPTSTPVLIERVGCVFSHFLRSFFVPELGRPLYWSTNSLDFFEPIHSGSEPTSQSLALPGASPGLSLFLSSASHSLSHGALYSQHET